ncbi:hypothetical protein OESDEN_02033 [Oesophagostomum dentatum]|uniref:G-protein coupled receptors family 1 profile domain-containing protein n=1 Tax=Oesophagostomum dentatum TaxID=61180 RepID=A0A0B1TQ72_OESDE|nr:hypothetical protein OESDEN_02033 [Oesophagostomum dentatum]
MDFLLLAMIVSNVIVNLIGISANIILAFLVIKKTRKELRNYSILILNCAVFDFVACICSLFVDQRLIPSELGYFFFSHGPCRLFGATACYFGYIVMLHCYPHGLYSLFYSFCYRYYILSHDQPKISTIIATLAAVYSPSFFQLVRHFTLLIYFVKQDVFRC